jgi:antitoxin (DNA-binding transcriptional repressor) of toxin-antitoxin stability system
VVICRGKKPVAMVVAIGAARKKRIPGSLKEQISYSPDAFDPLTEQEMKDLGFE